MEKREDRERREREYEDFCTEHQNFCKAHDAIVRTVDRLRRGGLTEEWTIVRALMAHATELTATTHGPKAGRAWLRKFLYPPSSLEICADCGLVTVERGYAVKDGIWKRAWTGRRRLKCEFLCVPCLENRIGRRLRSRDFQPSGFKGISKRAVRQDTLGISLRARAHD
jgi:hypothetical protein